MATTDAAQTIDRFVAAWERADVGELLDYFTEDAVWHPMPMEPRVGKPAIRDLVVAWLRTAPRGEVHRQVSDANMVMHERTDTCTFGGGDWSALSAQCYEVPTAASLRGVSTTTRHPSRSRTTMNEEVRRLAHQLLAELDRSAVTRRHR
jgi:limonene-1,2-epoxide hydrolase